MILHIQQGLKEDGFTVPMTKLCRWFDVPRRTVYYKPVKSTPKVQERFAEPIKQMSEAEPSFGYRTVASLLQFNKNTVSGSSNSRAGRSHRASTTDRGAPVGRHDAERTLGDRSLPRLGGRP